MVTSLLLCAGCRHARTSPVGNASRGRDVIQSAGCGTCHVIDGVPGATGQVGPALTGIASRAILAGQLANTPDNMLRWIVNPQAIEPRVAMPAYGNIGDQSARDIVAYLLTLE